MSDEKTNKVSLEINLNKNIIVGTSNGTSSLEQDIGRRIVESISRGLRGASDNWLKAFDEKIATENYGGAFEIFEENKGLLQFTKDKTILLKLRSMNVSKLDKNSRKEYLIFIIAFASHTNARAEVSKEIEDLLNEYQEELEPILLQNLTLEKANIAAQSGFHNKASILYKKVISSTDSDSGTIAWAYQGLSKISDNDEDSISFSEKAADKHLESGERNEAICNLLSMSDIKSKNSPAEAVKLIDRCIDLYGTESLLDRELLASLKFRKSLYLQRIGNIQEALPLAEHASELRRGLIGNEVELHASLSLAAILAKANGEHGKFEEYQEESNNLSKLIDNESFVLRREICEAISKKIELDDALLAKIASSGEGSTFSAALLYQSTSTNLTLEDSLELLDRARLLIEGQPDKRLLDIIYFSIAEKYRHEGLISEAFDNYKKTLSLNQHFNSAAQNCAAMLFDAERWGDAETFIKARIDITGELPGICFAYGRALFENKKFPLAFKYLKKASPDAPDRNKYLENCLENISTSELSTLDHAEETSNIFITAEEFYRALEEFAFSVSSDSRMHFWNRDKESGEYKWTKNPEELSKQMLITFLNGKFGKESIEILQEPRAGAGFIDLYILLSGGLKIVIELKMCGAGYSSTYALSGESQIIHYQLNKGTKLGYLIVFDARARDYGKHFKRLQNINGHSIYTTAIDMRLEVSKK